jgi:ubiquinone/menaquinone biosynthesis C-methylase UbiE
MHVIYQAFAPLHDPALRLAIRLVDGIPEEHARERLVDALGLPELRRPSPTAPLRVLDLCCGSGSDLLAIGRRLPLGTEYAALDLSERMLTQALPRFRRAGLPVQAVLGDAHRLPWAGDSFDLVIHVGAISAFTDPARALREMVRVAAPGAILYVVDEELDRRTPLPRWQRLLFRASTFWTRDARAPTDRLPQGVTDVRQDQLVTFYYGLRMKKAPPADGSPSS